MLFFFKQKTAYEMRISDWSSDVCSSDLIAYALAHPDRGRTPFGRIDWASLARLDFEPPDLEAFPCLGLAYQAGRAGELAPATLNAANEVAVEAFLAGRIRWTTIPDVLSEVLSRHDGGIADSVAAVIDADRRARAGASVGMDTRLPWRQTSEPPKTDKETRR